MTININQKAPSLPYAPIQYGTQYQDQLNNVLRLYFNNIDAILYEVVTLLNNGGYFPEIDAGTINADNVNASTGNVSTLLANYITAKSLYSQAIQAGSVQAPTIVGGNVTTSRCNSSLFTGLGAEITLPHIGASDSTDQYAGGNDTPTKVKWNTLDTSYGFTLASNEATAAYDGVYKIDYSLQFVNTSNGQEDVFVWLQVNGSNVAGSTTQFTVPARKSAGVYGYLCAYSTVTFSVNAGDTFALYWATPLAYNTTGPIDGVYMEYVASQASPYARPSIPSAIGAITYMSAPQPPLTRVAPVGIVGVGGVGTPTISITR